jgi:hypothetical protein
VPDAAAVLDSIQRLAAQDPATFRKLVVEVLCTLAEVNRNAYEYLISGIMAREMEMAGFLVALEEAKQALASGFPDRASERLSVASLWLNSVEYLGSRKRLEFLVAEEQRLGLTLGPEALRLYVM